MKLALRVPLAAQDQLVQLEALVPRVLPVLLVPLEALVSLVPLDLLDLLAK